MRRDNSNLAERRENPRHLATPGNRESRPIGRAGWKGNIRDPGKGVPSEMPDIPVANHRNHPRKAANLESYAYSTSDHRGYAHLPSRGFPNMVVGSCPPFAPPTYQNLERDVKFRIPWKPGAPIAHCWLC